MSIFTAGTTFELILHYVEVKNKDGIIISVNPANPNSANVKILNCTVKSRDFDTMSKIMEDSTIINHITGKPMVRSGTLCRLILINFFEKWDAKDSIGVLQPINADSIGKVDYKIVRALAKKWLNETSGKGV